MVGYEDRVVSDYGHSLRLNITLKLLGKLGSSNSYSSLLDVGCDGGLMTSTAEQLYSFVVGIDISKTTLPNATPSTSPKSAYILADAESIPFKHDSFDISLCAEVLEHCPNYKKCLDQLVKITRNWIIISIPGSPTPFGLLLYRFLYCLRGIEWPGKAYLLIDQSLIGNLKGSGHLHNISISDLHETVNGRFVLRKIISVGAVASFPWGCGLGSLQWTFLGKIPHIGTFLYRILKMLDLKLDEKRSLIPFASVYILTFQRCE